MSCASTSLVQSDSLQDCFCNGGFTGAGGGDCTVCVAGKYKEVPGDSACISCEVGHYSTTVAATSRTTCLSCPSNSNSGAASAFLTDCKCNSGSTGSDGFACSLCAAGTYKIATGSVACTNCSANQYSTVIGATSDVCLGCNVHSTSPETSTKQLDCICDAGFTGPNGGLACAACVAGTF